MRHQLMTSAAAIAMAADTGDAAAEAAAEAAAAVPEAPTPASETDLTALAARVAALESGQTVLADETGLLAGLIAMDERAQRHGCSVLELLALTARSALGIDLREPAPVQTA